MHLPRATEPQGDAPQQAACDVASAKAAIPCSQVPGVGILEGVASKLERQNHQQGQSYTCTQGSPRDYCCRKQESGLAALTNAQHNLLVILALLTIAPAVAAAWPAAARPCKDGSAAPPSQVAPPRRRALNATTGAPLGQRDCLLATMACLQAGCESGWVACFEVRH